MANPKDRDWIQIAGTVGVIAGLLLVAYEVRQANNFAQAEAIRAMYDGYDLVSIETMSSDISDVYIRSIQDSDSLTDEDIVKLDSWYTVQINQYDNRMVMQKRGLNPYDTLAAFESDFEYYFGSSFGRAWFARNKGWMEPELADLIEQKIAQVPTRSAPEIVEYFRSRMENQE